MLLSALSWGRLGGDPVHNEVRPDVGAAIYSSVSPKEGHRLTRSHQRPDVSGAGQDRKSTRLNSSHANISYAVFCLKKKGIAHVFPPDSHHYRLLLSAFHEY